MNNYPNVKKKEANLNRIYYEWCSTYPRVINRSSFCVLWSNTWLVGEGALIMAYGWSSDWDKTAKSVFGGKGPFCFEDQFVCIEHLQIGTSVTLNFRHFGYFFHGQFFITPFAKIIRLYTFFNEKIIPYIPKKFFKYGLGNILGDFAARWATFFTKASGHPAPLQGEEQVMPCTYIHRHT
jgi:hypothetical protein